MTRALIVADAGPLIGLALAGRVEILRSLFSQIVIPGAVRDELRLGESKPGSRALSNAEREGWISAAHVPESSELTKLSRLLDRGEAEAIVLARSKDSTLLIDERRGRAVARSKGVTVIGTGGVLLLAKRDGLIERIAPVLDELASRGYRLSDALQREILRLAGEA